jgi:hypothetical protein
LIATIDKVLAIPSARTDSASSLKIIVAHWLMSTRDAQQRFAKRAHNLTPESSGRLIRNIKLSKSKRAKLRVSPL